MVLSSAPEARRPSGSTASALTRTLMAFEACQLLSGFRVPEPDGSVGGARGEAAIGQRRQRVDLTPWPSSRASLLAGFGVPEPDGAVVRARGEAAIGQHRQRGDPTGMAFEPGQLLLPVLASQSRMVLSSAPEARRPSGSTASALT